MAENLPDPGGGPPQSSQLEDWKFITNNSRIVVLPDPRINALINSDCVSDDQSSNGNSDHVHGEGLDELEYDHEPGIALHQLEFGRPCTTDDILEEYAPIQHRARCPQCGVDYESDLQLAAELGKTLLERNKELEGSIKDQQTVIDDQSQEIEYLTKQATTLKDVNDSRVKIYEQLEVSISELESTNKKLIDENQSDKVKIKSLCDNIGNLENRCEELQKLLDDARTMIEKQQQAQRRRRERRKSSSQSQSRMEQTKDSPDDDEEQEEEESNNPSAIVQEESNHQSDEESDCRTGSGSSGSGIPESGYSSGSVESHLHRLDHSSDSETSSPERSKLSLEEELLLDRLKVDKQEIEERLQEMEKVVTTLQKENQRLQTMFSSQSSQDSLKSVDDEVQDVHDVRRGKLCRKCLNLVDATPATLIGTAFHLMGETAVEELQKVIAKWQKDELRLRSRSSWLDLWCLAVCLVALAISVFSSMYHIVLCT